MQGILALIKPRNQSSTRIPKSVNINAGDLTVSDQIFDEQSATSESETSGISQDCSDPQPDHSRRHLQEDVGEPHQWQYLPVGQNFHRVVRHTDGSTEPKRRFAGDGRAIRSAEIVPSKRMVGQQEIGKNMENCSCFLGQTQSLHQQQGARLKRTTPSVDLFCRKASKILSR